MQGEPTSPRRLGLAKSSSLSCRLMMCQGSPTSGCMKVGRQQGERKPWLPISPLFKWLLRSRREATEETSPCIHSLANRRPFYCSPTHDGPLFGCSLSPTPSLPVMKNPKFVPEAVYLTVWKRTTVCCGKSSRLGCSY